MACVAPGTRNALLWPLAMSLRQCGASDDEAVAKFREWWATASSHCRTGYEQTERDFWRAWRRAHPKGELTERLLAADPGGNPAHRLAVLMHGLSREYSEGDAPCDDCGAAHPVVFMSAEKLRQLLGLADRKCAWRLQRDAESAGWLRCVQRGTQGAGGRATRWAFCAARYESWRVAVDNSTTSGTLQG